MIDQIILSCNEDPIYSEFWPVVARAYTLMGFKPHLAFLTNREENDPVVIEMRQHGEVTLFPILPDIPQFGQAKMIRFILASGQIAQVCYIDDIDLIPLSASFIYDKVAQRPDTVLLCVGAEVYGWNGCCPVSQMTSEGWLWQQFINPKSLSYSDLMHSWTTYFFDIREKINIEQTAIEGGFKDDIYFSDERLIRRLLRENPVPVLNIKRGYDNYLDATIDRATVNSNTGEWIWDKEKLARGEYVNVHGARPYSKYKKDYDLIMEYLEGKYK